MFGVKFYLILLNRNVKLPDYLPLLNHYKNQLQVIGNIYELNCYNNWFYKGTL